MIVFLRAPSDLTEREAEVLALVAKGHSVREIAARLGLSYQTVRGALSRAIKRLGARNRTHAVALWILGMRERKAP